MTAVVAGASREIPTANNGTSNNCILGSLSPFRERIRNSRPETGSAWTDSGKEISNFIANGSRPGDRWFARRLDLDPAPGLPAPRSHQRHHSAPAAGLRLFLAQAPRQRINLQTPGGNNSQLFQPRQ